MICNLILKCSFVGQLSDAATARGVGFVGMNLDLYYKPSCIDDAQDKKMLRSGRKDVSLRFVNS